MRATNIALALASGVVLLALPIAIAQPAATPPSPQVIQQVYACATVTDATARLACYDTAVGALKSAEAQGEFAAVDAAGVHRLEREAFGFSLPSLPHLGLPGLRSASADSGDSHDATNEVAMTITRIGATYGRTSYVMDNGQTWVASDGEGNPLARAGGRVKVRRAALGSYLMKVEAGGAPVRVRRLE